MPRDEEEPYSQEIEDIRLQIVHARHELRDREQARKEARRAYMRDWYAKNRDQQADYQRQYREAQRDKDPEKYRTAKRARTQRWRDNHKDEVNAKLREKYRADPEKHRERRRQFYEENAERIRQERRERYAANKAKELERQRAWRDRERRRRDAGLPAYRLHRTPREERIANRAAADAFFSRTWTQEELVEAHKSIAITPQEWAAWRRDCDKARALHALSERAEELQRLQKELNRKRPGPKPKHPTEQELEEARMDEIARGINARLRHKEPQRRAHHLDPAAPHPMLQQNNQMGMNR